MSVHFQSVSHQNPSDLRYQVYLISDLSSGVTGETHFVDGGFNTVGVPREL